MAQNGSQHGAGGEKKHAVVIGAGFAGLAAACSLAKKGWSVTVLEKNEQLGGRCRTWEKDGFHFDMGPSWYWMPEVFENFYAEFGKKASDFYKLKRLDPPYKLFFQEEEFDVPDTVEDLGVMFEAREKGAGAKLKAYLADAAYKYKVGMTDFVWRPSIAFREFFDPWLIVELFRLQMLTSQRDHVQKHFKNPILVKLMEWPVLFLGGGPADVPALYSMMSHCAIVGGTWWPEGGMKQMPAAMVSIAKSLGVEFINGAAGNVTKIEVDRSGKAIAVQVEPSPNSATYTDAKTGKRRAGYALSKSDVVVGAADYHFVEQTLLDKQWRMYTENYWDKRVLSPGSLLMYLGLNRSVPNLRHHNLFFDEDIDEHVVEIYENPRWPKKPLFYASLTSLTEPAMAPKGSSSLFLLVPLAPGLADDDASREECYNKVMQRLEKRCGVADGELRKAVVVKRLYATKDFESDYNSYKGNAYGLANLLSQTAVFKPSIKPGKVSNLYFAGQMTSPGPGMPPSIISGQVVANLIEKDTAAAAAGSSIGCKLCVGALIGVALLGWQRTRSR